MKRICIFKSSPRANGNSDKLADAFVRGAIEAGNIVHSIIIRNLKINGCIGCEYCYEHEGECLQQDDMQDVYNILAKTDLVVFATPIYYQSFPSQLKAVIDRLYVTENRKFPICSSILLTTYATPGTDMAEQTISYYKCLIEYHGWIDLGIIAVSGLDGKDDIEETEYLIKATEFGMTIS